jgi:hypothetical protein
MLKSQNIYLVLQLLLFYYIDLIKFNIFYKNDNKVMLFQAS